MRLAEAAGIEVPAHGLVRGRDGTWAVVNRFVKTLDSARPRWKRWIEVSFLPEALKGAYLELMSERFERLSG